MTTYERRQSLLHLLQKQPGLSVSELAVALDVSKGTIRNDLDALEQSGLAMRVHGGAILLNNLPQLDSSFAARLKNQQAEKLMIAREASSLVRDGASLFLDASSTVYFLAQQLLNCHRLRVITNGIDVARLLAKDSTNTVILLGGVLTQDGASVAGSLSEQIVRDLHVQMAFISCSGLSLDRGLTDVLLAEAELKTIAIQSAQEIFVLVDSSKIGKKDLTSFASLNQISRIFTDHNLSEEKAAAMRTAGIQLTVCTEKVPV